MDDDMGPVPPPPPVPPPEAFNDPYHGSAGRASLASGREHHWNNMMGNDDSDEHDEDDHLVEPSQTHIGSRSPEEWDDQGIRDLDSAIDAIGMGPFQYKIFGICAFSNFALACK